MDNIAHFRNSFATDGEAFMNRITFLYSLLKLLINDLLGPYEHRKRIAKREYYEWKQKKSQNDFECL